MAWRLHPYRLPLARRYLWARGDHGEREGALVWSDGGWGEIAYAPDTPFDPAAVHRMLHAAGADGALRADGITDPRVRCGVATAAADRQARAQGVPLADVLGRPARRSVAVNGLVVGDEGIAEQVADAVRQGIAVLKVKCGADRERDMRRVEAVRDAAPHATLRLDANCAWAPEWALAHMEALAPMGIDYVEQPLAPAEAAASVRLAARAPFLVAADEAATDPDAVRRLLSSGACHLVILKPQRLGGPDRTVTAMQAAEDAGARAIVTNSLESSIGIHAALHCAALLRRDEPCGLATSGFLAQDLAPAPKIHEGRILLPTVAGLGVAPAADFGRSSGGAYDVQEAAP